MEPLLFSLLPSPPSPEPLALLLDGINDGICDLFLHKNRKTKQNGISESLKSIFSNPNILKDRKLRFRGEIDLCKVKWEVRISRHWNPRTGFVNLSPSGCKTK